MFLIRERLHNQNYKLDIFRTVLNDLDPSKTICNSSKQFEPIEEGQGLV